MALPDGLTFEDIDLTQVAAKAVVDDLLMHAVAEDIYYLKALATSGGGSFDFKVNGDLSRIAGQLPFRRIDGAFVTKTGGTTLSSYGLYLEKPGSNGTLEIDIRKYRSPLTPITGIDLQFQAAINSITRAGASGATQSITKATPQVNTQSIAFWKAAINVSSIIHTAGDNWRYNLASVPDADFKVGDSITFASCTSGGNNGTFVILEVNQDSLGNVVVRNTAGVAQTSAAGTAQLQAMSYTLINPATSSFVAGETARFAAHTSGANNGDFVLYATNQGGNNLIVKNAAGVTQGGVAGTCDALRWLYTLAATVSADIVAGETALFASHTSAVNDGKLPVKVVSGSTVTVYNTAGALQGGVAGAVDSLRWIYALASDPASSFAVGHTFFADSTTLPANAGLFTVVQIDRSATSNLVIHNDNGATQGGAAGTLTHTRRLVKFAADQAAVYAITVSRIKLKNVPDLNYSTPEFQVVEVNRGGGSNFNAVIEDTTGASGAQPNPAGHVVFESRSVFSTRPSITVLDELQVATNGVLDTAEKVVVQGRLIALEVLQVPGGTPYNLTAHVS